LVNEEIAWVSFSSVLKLKPSTFAPFSELTRSSLGSVFTGLQAKSNPRESNTVDEQKINFDRYCVENIFASQIKFG
jgi:hypothetical protein